MQAIQCVVNSAYPHVTKHCIVTIAINSTLPKSVCTIQGTVKVGYLSVFANRQLPFPIGERKKVVVVSEDKNKQFDPSLGATVMTVSSLTKQAEAGDLLMDAIFTTPDLVSKLVPIAPVLVVEKCYVDTWTQTSNAFYQTRDSHWTHWRSYSSRICGVEWV